MNQAGSEEVVMMYERGLLILLVQQRYYLTVSDFFIVKLGPVSGCKHPAGHLANRLSAAVYDCRSSQLGQVLDTDACVFMGSCPRLCPNSDRPATEAAVLQLCSLQVPQKLAVFVYRVSHY